MFIVNPCLEVLLRFADSHRENKETISNLVCSLADSYLNKDSTINLSSEQEKVFTLIEKLFQKEQAKQESKRNKEKLRKRKQREKKKLLPACSTFIPPTVQEVKDYAEKKRFIAVKADLFVSHYESRRWTVKNKKTGTTTPIKNISEWHRLVKRWNTEHGNRVEQTEQIEEGTIKERINTSIRNVPPLADKATLRDIQIYKNEKHYSLIDPVSFLEYCENHEWKVGGKPIHSWRKLFDTFEKKAIAGQEKREQKKQNIEKKEQFRRGETGKIEQTFSMLIFDSSEEEQKEEKPIDNFRSEQAQQEPPTEQQEQEPVKRKQKSYLDMTKEERESFKQLQIENFNRYLEQQKKEEQIKRDLAQAKGTQAQQEQA